MFGKKKEGVPAASSQEKAQAPQKTQEQIAREAEAERVYRAEQAKIRAQQEEEARKLQQQVDARDQTISNLEVAIPKRSAPTQETTSTTEKRVMSIIEKLNAVTVNEDGSLSHQFFKAKDGSPRKFKDADTHKKWVTKHIRERKQDLKEKLSPLQIYITQGMGTERPFTGQYWWLKDAGVYSCVCCSQRLFMSEHKYENPSGFATFWNHIIDSVGFKDDNLDLPKVTNAHVDTLLKNRTPIKRCVCSNCEAHLGHVFADGPAPFGKRIQINSASLNFLPKKWNEAPKYTYEERVQIGKKEAQMKRG